MSGHSKWSKIHRQKGVADNKRGALFTKLGKAISVAARLGGGDPAMNFKLQLAIDQAKANNLPKDNIDRAIKRGTGELGGGTIEEVIYEGFGPGGVAIIVECLTDNKNRTVADIKHLFTKLGGNLGGQNSVAWMFELTGVIRLNKMDENLELGLIEAGANDIFQEADGWTVITPPANLQGVKNFLKTAGVGVEYAEVEHAPKDKKTIDEQTKTKLEIFFEALDENQDVNNFYTNADL